MGQTARSEIQAAIYTKLMPGGTLDSQLAALGVVGVFDLRAVPDNQPFDYLIIGDSHEMPMNTLGRRGYEVTTTIHIFSRQRGAKATDGMIARLNALLDQQPLTLATHTHVGTFYEDSRDTAQPDGLTLHTLVMYRIITQE